MRSLVIADGGSRAGGRLQEGEAEATGLGAAPAPRKPHASEPIRASRRRERGRHPTAAGGGIVTNPGAIAGGGGGGGAIQAVRKAAAPDGCAQRDEHARAD